MTFPPPLVAGPVRPAAATDGISVAALEIIPGSDLSSPIEGSLWYNAARHRLAWRDETGTNDIYPASSAAAPSTAVLRDGAGNFAAGTITAALTGTASQASALDDGTSTFRPGSYYLNFGNSTGTRTHAAISDFDSQVRVSRLDQMAAPSAPVSFGGQALTNLAAPVNPADATNKAYVDSIAQGLQIKAAVRVATITALPAYAFSSASGGTLTASGNGALVVDGVSVALNDRVLVMGETAGNAPYNGIYVVSQVGSGGTPYILTRSPDANISAEVVSGIFVFVTEGGVNAQNGFVLSTSNPIVLNTTPLTFTQFSGAGEVIAGAGLTKAGNTLSVLLTPRLQFTAGYVDLVATGAGAGVYTAVTVDTYGRVTAGVDIVSTTGLVAKTAAGTFTARSVAVGSGLTVSHGDGVAGNPTVAIDPSYAGQASITTLGTVGTGAWQASTIGPTYGGTGLNAATAANGTLLIGNGSGFALATLSSGANIAITNGVGSVTIAVSGLTAWATKTYPADAGGLLRNNGSGTLSWDTSNYLTANQSITLSGDVGGSGSISITTVLASIIAAGGPVGAAATVPVITYDAKGRLTAVTTASITPSAIGALPASGGTNGYLTMWTGAGTIGSSQYLPAANMVALTGDVTNVAGDVATTISAGVVTLAKMANIAANSIMGNNTVSPATPLALTSGQVVTMLGLTAWATKTYPADAAGLLRNNGSGTLSWDTSTYLTANQTITLSGDVTGSGATAITTTIAAGAVSLAKMANLAANSIIGNNTASPATPVALTQTQVTAMVNTFTTSLAGTVPGSGGGTTNFLRADGTWTVPGGGGTIGGSIAANQVAYGSGSNAIQGASSLTYDGTTLTLTQPAASSGVASALVVVTSASTGLTASTESNAVSYNLSATRTWVGSATPITTQREFLIQAPTYSFSGGTGSGTITNAATFAITGAPVAGSGATLSNTFALWVQAGTARFAGLIQATGGLSATQGATIGNSGSTGSTSLFVTQSVTGSGNVGVMTVTSAATTNQNTGVEINAVNFNLSATRTWAAGAISIQREFWIQAPTYAFASGSNTISTAATFAISGAPITGANATINAALALWVQAGNSQMDGQLTMTAGTRCFNSGNGARVPLQVTLTNAGSGAVSTMTVTPGNTTGQTASTEVIAVNYNLVASRTWANGNITTQREFLIQAPTYAFSSGSNTITNAATFAITGAPVTGTNATLTNAWALWVQGGTSRFDGDVVANGNLVVGTAALSTSATTGFLYLDTCAGAPSGVPTSYTGAAALVYNTTSNALYVFNGGWQTIPTYTNASTGRVVYGSGGTVLTADTSFTYAPSTGLVISGVSRPLAITQGAPSSGSSSTLSVTTGAATGQTTLTEVIGANFNMSATRTWADGSFATQREVLIQAPTYAFTSTPSTITKAATFAITGAPVAGTNATLTNAYALWVQAGLAQFDGGLTSTAGTSTFGTANITGLTVTKGTVLQNSGGSGATVLQVIQTVATSGAIPLMVATTAANTTQTASTEIIAVNYNLSATRSWATGDFATQREFVVQAPTYAFAGTSTITTAATFAITNAPTAGTNATLTNAYALWVQAGLTKVDGGFQSTGTTAITGGFSCTRAFSISNGGANTTVPLTITQSAAPSGAVGALTVTSGASTGQTAATEVNAANFNFSATRTWVAGSAIATQREFVVQAPTYAFSGGASTITKAATFAITGAPTAGTNATLTNAYALWVQSGATQLDGTLFITSTSTLNVASFTGAVTTRVGLTAKNDLNATVVPFTVTQSAAASGTASAMVVTSGASTNLTASTEVITANFNLSATRSWAAGAITTQREFVVQAPTYAFASASTITNAATFAITGAPAVGTNATLTNTWALWVQGGTSRFDGTISANGNLVVGTAALSTSATTGFFYVDTCAGVPTGVPSSFTGAAAMVYDTTDSVLYVFNGGWVAANAPATITLTGNVTGSGTTSIATTIAAGAVTLAMHANLAANSIMGNNTGSPTAPLALTTTQVKTLLAIASTDVSGLTAWATKAYPTDAAGLLRNNGSGTLSWDTSTYLTANQTITLSGDVTGSGTTAITATIAASAVTLAKMANLAANSIIGNNTASPTAPIALTTTQVKTLLAIASTDVSGLTAWATKAYPTDAAGLLRNNGSGTLSWDTSTYLTGNQTITLSGDVTGSGTTAITTTIAAGAVTLAKMANLAANSIIGNNTGSPTTPVALTVAQAKTLLAISTSDVSGLTAWATTANYPTNAAGLLRNNGSGTLSWDTSTYLTGNQTITLTGDISGSGTTAITTTIGAGKVTLAMYANLAANSIIGNNTASPATPVALTATQVKTLLAIASTDVSGLTAWATKTYPTDASGLLRNNGSGTLSWDTSTYLTANQSITLSGDATGSGTTAITVALANVIAAGGPTGSSSVVPVITYDAKGRLTAVTTANITAASVGAIGGSIASGQVAYGSGSNTVQGSAAFTYSGSLLTISANAGAVPAALTASSIQLAGVDASTTPTRIMLDAFTASAGNTITGRRSRGTAGTPTGVVSGDILLSFTGYGFGTTIYSALSRARIQLNATETWTDTANGAEINFAITPNTTTGTYIAATIGNDGSFTLRNGTNVGISLLPQGGAANFVGTITSALLSATRTYTLPDASGTLAFGTGTANQVGVWSAANTLTGLTSFTFSTAAGLAVALGTTSAFTSMSTTGAINNYFEHNNQNTSNGIAASSDFVATADTGNASSQYIDLGINSSSYTGNVFGVALEGYLYTSDNNLNIGAAAANKGLRVLAGGADIVANTVATFFAAASTFLNPLITVATTATVAGFNLAPGVAPTAPNAGDVWETSLGIYANVSGVVRSALANQLVSAYITAGRAMLISDQYIEYSGSGGDTVTLISAAAVTTHSLMVIVKNRSSGVLYVAPNSGSETIEGVTGTIAVPPGGSYTLVANKVSDWSLN